MDLIIVESPTKARTLKKFLGSEYQVEASMGHVRDLPQKGGGMAIDIENDFAPKYEVISDKKKIVAGLRKLALTASDIYLAPDPDREGEAIAHHVEWLLSKDGGGKTPASKFKRVTFHEITKSAIMEAMKHPGRVNMELVDAQTARRVLDRLVGYTLSPVLWKKVRRGLSAGRVQSVALKLIVEKEREILAFIPEEFWEVYVDLTKAKEKAEVRVQLTKIDGKTAKITDGKAAKQIEEELKTAEYAVSDVVKQRQASSPNPPFTTALLQRAASNLWGWSAKQTMSTAQALYEHGFITYHRTDSYNLASEAIEGARKYIKEQYGEKYIPEKPRYYKTSSKSAQEAHEAIRPTEATRTGSEIEGGKLGPKHEKLYELIKRRLLQSQMADAIYDKTTIVVSAGKYELTAAGKRMIFDGWMKLGKMADDVLLPDWMAGEKLNLKKVEPVQKFTQPPTRYNEAGLIKELEKRGIGRPSTYASIISTIQARMYVTKEEKRFVPTAVGLAVTDFLVKHFEKVMAYEFTAKMEDQLDEIAEGKEEWVKVVKTFWGPFEKLVKEVEGSAERMAVPVESTGEKCPDCKKGDIVIRTGRFGKFYSCSTYPECKYTKQFVEYATGHLCPECGGRVVVKGSRRGKFYGCEKYPKCKWATWKLPKKE
ncbi:MAG: type I DNA topoisomerase [bacterium]